MDPEIDLPVLEQKKRAVREAMQPIEAEQTPMLGSLKSRQKRLRHIHQGLLLTEAIQEPSLDNLNEEQLDVLRLALDGYSLYITGAAGT